MSNGTSKNAPRKVLKGVPKNAYGRTLDSLGSAIVGGQYPAGSVMPPEPRLCEALEVSRTVIREVVKSLVAKGLVHTGPKVGTKVLSPDAWHGFDADVVRWQSLAGLSRELLRDLQELRALVEPVAARLAAERAQPQDLLDLQAACTGMEQAIEAGGDGAGPYLAFHTGLLKASGNRMLMQMGPALAAVLRTSFELSLRDSEGLAASLPRRKAVLDAVLAGSPRRAEKAANALVDAAGVGIAGALSSKRKLPSLKRASAAPKVPSLR